jgi:hypothetical protein
MERGIAADWLVLVCLSLPAFLLCTRDAIQGSMRGKLKCGSLNAVRQEVTKRLDEERAH